MSLANENNRIFVLTNRRASVVMRRPNMLRSNIWIDNCVRFLGSHGTTSALDNVLVALVKLFQLTEEVVIAFSLDVQNSIANCMIPYLFTTITVLSSYRSEVGDLPSKSTFNYSSHISNYMVKITARYMHQSSFFQVLAPELQLFNMLC